MNWQAISGLNDVDNGLAAHLDFVGDATNGGAFWASNDNYLFFRMRVDADTVTPTTYSDTLLIMVDRVGDSRPDYAFAWDTRQKHGMELQIQGTVGTTWSTTSMNDIDDNPGQVVSPDFNTNGRTGDGYLRTTDGQMTTNFDATTYVDWAVSWDFLTNAGVGYPHTALTPNDALRVQFASISNSNDHAAINADVAGGASPSSTLTYWSTEFETSSGDDAGVPEPGSLSLLALAVGAVLAGRRRRRA